MTTMQQGSDMAMMSHCLPSKKIYYEESSRGRALERNLNNNTSMISCEESENSEKKKTSRWRSRSPFKLRPKSKEPKSSDDSTLSEETKASKGFKLLKSKSSTESKLSKDPSKGDARKRSRSPLARMARSIADKAKSSTRIRSKSHKGKGLKKTLSSSDLTAAFTVDTTMTSDSSSVDGDDMSILTSETLAKGTIIMAAPGSPNVPKMERSISSLILPALTESFSMGMEESDEEDESVHNSLEKDDLQSHEQREEGMEVQLISPSLPVTTPSSIPRSSSCSSLAESERVSISYTKSSQSVSDNTRLGPSSPRSKARRQRNQRLRSLQTKANVRNIDFDRALTPQALRSRVSPQGMAKLLMKSNRSGNAAVRQLRDQQYGITDPSKKNSGSSFYSFAYNKIVNDQYATYVNKALEAFSRKIGYSA